MSASDPKRTSSFFAFTQKTATGYSARWQAREAFHDFPGLQSEGGKVASDSSRADGWSPISRRPRHQGADKDIRKSVRNHTLRIKNHFASLLIVDCFGSCNGNVLPDLQNAMSQCVLRSSALSEYCKGPQRSGLNRATEALPRVPP